MIDAVAAKKAFDTHFTTSTGADIRRIGEGWDSVVYLAGETQVLRFPKTAAAARALAIELKLLPFLQKQLPLPIPHPNVVGEHPINSAWPFMGYPDTIISYEQIYPASAANLKWVTQSRPDFARCEARRDGRLRLRSVRPSNAPML